MSSGNVADHSTIIMTDQAPAAVALPPALHALARELPSRRLARGIEQLSAEVARGVSWKDALAANSTRLPAYLRGLLQAGIRGGRLPNFLVRLVHLQQQSQQLRREIWLTLAYPILLLAASVALFFLYELFFIQDILNLYNDLALDLTRYGTSLQQLPTLSQVMFFLSRPAPLLAMAAVVALVGLLIVYRVAVHPRWLDAWFNRLPLLGPLWRQSAVADSLRLTALLLEAEIRLPQALAMTADATANGEIAAGYWQLSRSVEAGQSLAEAARQCEAFAGGFVPMIQWGERHAQLDAALLAAAEMLDGRVRVQLRFVRTFVPPFIFLIVAGAILCALAAVCLPMFNLMNSLM